MLGVRWSVTARLASQNRAQAARAARGAAGLGARAARRGGLPAEDGRDATTRTRARRRVRARGRAGGRVDARRGLGHRGRGARRRARHPLGALRAPAAASVERLLAELGARGRARARATSASSCDRARTARSCAARASLEGRDRRGAARLGGLRLRPGLRPGGEERTVAELGDEWKARNSHRARAAAAWKQRPGAVTVQARPAASSRRCRPGGARVKPPVHLGAEDDHVRHHVEPDEQERRAAERLQRTALFEKRT